MLVRFNADSGDVAIRIEDVSHIHRHRDPRGGEWSRIVLRGRASEEVPGGQIIVRNMPYETLVERLNALIQLGLRSRTWWELGPVIDIQSRVPTQGRSLVIPLPRWWTARK